MKFPRRRLEPALLATFVAVADAKKVSTAADYLHLSQPAVTAQVRKLEDALRTSLFVRSARGVMMTAAGMRLYEFARQIEVLLSRAEEAVDETREPEGHLVLAASTTIGSYVLPGTLAAFCRRYPKVAVELIIENTERVLERVRGAKCPLGLVEGLARAPQLRLIRFADDELVLVRGTDPAGNALFNKPLAARNARDLAGFPFIWRELGSGTRAVVEQALRRAGVSPKRLSHALVLGNTEAIKAAVAEGLGLAFVSRWSIQSELREGRLAIVPLADLSIRRVLSWAFPSGALDGPAAHFVRFAQASAPMPRLGW
jgi:DNA-binding transcriptional LysR family regulator